MKAALPIGSIVPPGGYAIFQDGVNDVQLSLKTSVSGGAFLYSAADSGRTLTGYIHGFFFSRFPEGNSLIRHLDSEGKIQLVAAEPTPGAGNAPPAVGPVTITEIMYDPGEDGGTDEFLEIMNIGEVTAPLYDPADPSTNWRVNGIGFTINGIQPSLAPNEVALIVPTAPETFRADHNVAAEIQIFGPYSVGDSSPGLNNGGERIALQRPETIAGVISYVDVDVVDYNDKKPWPNEGQGWSIERIRTAFFGNDPANWRASFELGGSPGRAFDSIDQGVYINEILAHTDLPQTDAIELFNPNTDPVDISNWYLSDQRRSPKKFRIPAGTIIPGKGYWVVNEDNDDDSDTQPPDGYFGTPNGFALSENGDDVILTSADGNGAITGFQDRASFGGTDNGVSVGRVGDSQGRVHYVALSSVTFSIDRRIPNPQGAANTGPKIGPVVISEVYYSTADTEPEFLEVTNITESSVALYDDATGGDSTNNWLFSSGIEFTFPGVRPSLRAAGKIIILPEGVDPDAFRIANSVPENVIIHGDADGFKGALNNEGESMVLAKQGPPNAGEDGFAPIIPVDYVDYDDVAPWPQVGTLGGRSIERITLTSSGLDFDNWKVSNAVGGSPGTATSQGTVYDAWALQNFTNDELMTVGLTAPFDDYNGDGLPNLLAYAFNFPPKDPVNPAKLPLVVIGDSGAYLGVAFQRRSPPNDLIYVPQVSTDLRAWTTATRQEGEDQVNPDGSVSTIYRLPEAVDPENSGFARVSVSQP
jgi:hypothetical protein